MIRIVIKEPKMQEVSLEDVVESEKRARRLAIIGVVLSMVALAAVVAAVGFLVAGLRKTVEELSMELKRSEADAILASANINDAATVSVPVLYYDQKMDECANIYERELAEVVKARQFEWKECGYFNSEIETEMVEGVLGNDYLPVAVGGKMMPNRGVKDEEFRRWFATVEGASQVYSGMINFAYDAETASFEYGNERFYPLDEIGVKSEENVNRDGHNHLFTMNMGVPFRVLGTGEEEFEITADDDTWVFVGNKLVVDMGGVHDVTVGRVKISEKGEVYSAVGEEDFIYAGVNVPVNDGAIVRIFHADRNSESSVMKIRFSNMVLNLSTDALVANSEGNDGVMVAYDPSNPGYVAPLGESLTVRPNRSRSLAVSLTVEVMLFGMLAVAFVVVITRVLRKM